MPDWVLVAAIALAWVLTAIGVTWLMALLLRAQRR
jgi:hypothetical protein